MVDHSMTIHHISQPVAHLHSYKLKFAPIVIYDPNPLNLQYFSIIYITFLFYKLLIFTKYTWSKIMIKVYLFCQLILIV